MYESQQVHRRQRGAHRQPSNDGPASDRGQPGHHHLQRCLRSVERRHRRRLPLQLRLQRPATWRPLRRGRRDGQHDLHLQRQRHPHGLRPDLRQGRRLHPVHDLGRRQQRGAAATSTAAPTRPSTRAPGQPEPAASPTPAAPTPTPSLWHVGRRQRPDHPRRHGQTFSFTPNDNGSYAVTFTVTDDDGGANSDSATVTIHNVAPTATFNNDVRSTRAARSACQLSEPVRPVERRHRGRLHLRIRLRHAAWRHLAARATNSASCPTNDNGSRTVKGRIRDKDGGDTEYSATVTIHNVAPTATFNAPASVTRAAQSTCR